jgi:hypothetical protein
MECNKWEESGLLYVARELNQASVVDYEAHTRTCSFCAQQVELYKSDKARFFIREILCEAPSARVDQAIAQACAHPVRIAATQWNLFAGVKKVMVPLLLFVLGFGAGTYFVLNMQNAKTTTAVAVTQKVPATTPVDSLDSLRIAKLAQNDSVVKPMDKPFNSPSGNAADQIVPVKE